MGNESNRGELIEKVIKIKRCAAVVKGGRRFSFAALVVVGNGRGKVGWGYGKANEVPPSVEKASKDGQRSMIEIATEGGTIERLDRYSSDFVESGISGLNLENLAGLTAIVEARHLRNLIRLRGPPGPRPQRARRTDNCRGRRPLA